MPGERAHLSFLCKENKELGILITVQFKFEVRMQKEQDLRKSRASKLVCPSQSGLVMHPDEGFSSFLSPPSFRVEVQVFPKLHL